MNTSTKYSLLLFVAMMLIGLTTACSGNSAQQPKAVCGTLDGPQATDSVPSHILQAFRGATKLHHYELLSDSAAQLSVCAISEADEQSTEGYGFMITKGAQSTTFTSLRNTRQPKAWFDAAAGNLWLATSVMEGTGVQVESLNLIQFQPDDKAFIATTIDPFDLQQELCKRLTYVAHNAETADCIELYIDGQPADTLANSVADMGLYDDDALWIGEQLTYEFDGTQPRLCVTPGVKYITGLVLTYDDSPTITADISLSPEGIPTLSNLTVRH